MWTDSGTVEDAGASEDESEGDWDDWGADWIDWDEFGWDTCEVNRIWLLTYDDRGDSGNAYWLIDAYAYDDRL